MIFKDRVMLGIFSGLVSSIPVRLLNSIELRAGLTDLKYERSAASIFIKKNKLNTPEAKIVGQITHTLMCTLTGITTTYFLSITGRDKAMIKGTGVCATIWMGLVGLSAKLGLSIRNQKPLVPLLSFFDHVIFGATNGLVISKFGDKSLFPDRQITDKKGKLPLIDLSNKK